MVTPPPTYLPEETLIMAQIVEERFWYNMATHTPLRSSSAAEGDMEKRLQVIKSIVGLLTGSRIYVALSQRSLQRIWDIIRTDERLTDAVLELTIDFTRRWLSAGHDMRDLVENLAEAYSVPSQFQEVADKTNYRVTDDELVKNANNKPEIIALLANNYWFVMLLALEPLTARL